MRFDQGDPVPLADENSSRLQPYIAASNHHDMPSVPEVGPEIIDIGPLANNTDALQFRTAAGQTARKAPCRPDEFAIGNRFTVIQFQTIGSRRYRHDPTAWTQGDTLGVPEPDCSQCQLLGSAQTRKVILGERGALIGRIRLIAQQQNGTFISALPQGNCRLCAGMSGTDDDHRIVHGVQPSAITVTDSPSRAVDKAI